MDEFLALRRRMRAEAFGGYLTPAPDDRYHVGPIADLPPWHRDRPEPPPAPRGIRTRRRRRTGPHDRAWCQGCPATFALKLDGTIRTHNRRELVDEALIRTAEKCPGSGLKPGAPPFSERG